MTVAGNEDKFLVPTGNDTFWGIDAAFYGLSIWKPSSSK